MARVRQLYLGLLKDRDKIEVASRAVQCLKANEKKRLASDHLIRAYTHKAANPSRECRRVFNDEIHVVRTEAQMNCALEKCLGHIGTDILELSEIRIKAAATRALLYEEARQMQREEEARIVLAPSQPMGGQAQKASESTLRWALESYDLNDVIARVRKVTSQM